MADFQQYLAILDSDPVDDRVLDAIEAALAADGAADAPETRDALDQARRSLHDRGELDMVARLFDMEIAATGDAGRQADLLTDKGHLCAGDLLDDEGAVACFRQVMALRPDDETARDALDQMDMERENWRKFVQKNLDDYEGFVADEPDHAILRAVGQGGNRPEDRGPARAETRGGHRQ